MLAASFNVEDLRDCALVPYLKAAARGLEYFLLLGGLSDCFHVEIAIRSFYLLYVEEGRYGAIRPLCARGGGRGGSACCLLRSAYLCLPDGRMSHKPQPPPAHAR